MLTVDWLDGNDDADEPGWYVMRGPDRIAGPFDEDGEAEWWIAKYLEV